MEKTILYLEDDANMRIHTTDLLKEKGYNIEGFSRIDLIKEYFLEHMHSVECIITDLNMNDEWLNEYQIETDGGMLSGWVWLQRFVYDSKPEMPTIIYSGYISYLEEFLKLNDNLHLLEKKHIRCVEKGVNEIDGFEGLLLTLQELLNKGVV